VIVYVVSNVESPPPLLPFLIMGRKKKIKRKRGRK
jgi:hypothetical protein